MHNTYKYILLTALIALISTYAVVAQDRQKKNTRIQVEYFKNHIGSESVVATLKIREDRYLPLTDVEIHFYSITDTSRVLLDKIKTNSNGEAIYLIKDHQKIYKDSLGRMTFEAEYNGTSSTKGAKKDIEIQQVNLKIQFLQEDTTKYITVEVHEIEIDNTTTPVEELEILFYIKGFFSLLNIAQEETDEEGRARVEFPVEMPGDTAGVLTIVTKIEDNDIYGNVESRGVMNWGRPVPQMAAKHRGLGDTDAPLWMVYTLIILLSAVWFHYFYIIFLVIKIKLARRYI